MHPFGLYLAAVDAERNYGAGARSRRPEFAKVDAAPLTEPEPVSRRTRLIATLRRHVIKTAGA